MPDKSATPATSARGDLASWNKERASLQLRDSDLRLELTAALSDGRDTEAVDAERAQIAHRISHLDLLLSDEKTARRARKETHDELQWNMDAALERQRQNEEEKGLQKLRVAKAEKELETEIAEFNRLNHFGSGTFSAAAALRKFEEENPDIVAEVAS